MFKINEINAIFFLIVLSLVLIMYSLESRQHGHRTSRGVVAYTPTEANRRVPISPMETYGNNSSRSLPIYSYNPEYRTDSVSPFPQVSDMQLKQPIGSIYMPLAENTAYLREMGGAPFIGAGNSQIPSYSPYGQLNNYEKGEWMKRMKELHGTPGISSEERNAYAKKALADYMPYYANTGGNLKSASMTNLFK
jgi:hypothetical protein